MRNPLLKLLVPAAALAIAACADIPSAPTLSDARASSTHACPATISGLISQAKVLFAGDAPSFNSVRGKLQNMEQFLKKGKLADAQRRAHDIVDFTLAQHADGRLSGTDAQVTAFINGVFCLAGIDIVIPDPDDTWFILPSDQPQVLYGLDSSVGISLPANPVGEPSILRVEPFTGRLNTKLDQYPGFVRITLLNDGNSGLAGRATITVCASGLPSDLDPANLRLGHGIRDTGFVITPQPTGSDPQAADVACGPTEPTNLAARLLGAVRDVFAPKSLTAAQGGDNSFGGGVSGTVTEFSPFAPVDAELSFGGGVSGTVTEFIRERSAPSLMFSHETVAPNCTEVEFNTPLAAECQPVVNISTRNGTLLEQVPVDWVVRSDDRGRVAPRSGDLGAISCGAFGTTAATFTSANGNAGVCWTLGGHGNNRVVAKARAGGDAPAGVWFSTGSADSVVFDVNVVAPAGRPTQLQLISGNEQSGPAGTALAAPLTVRVLDDHGTPVANTTVNWLVLGGSGALGAATSLTNADGYATMSFTPGLGSNEVKAYIDAYFFKYVYFTATGTAP